MDIGGLNVFGSLTTKNGTRLTFKDFDVNGDGTVTKLEFAQVIKENGLDKVELSTVDTNQDKTISEDEFAIFEQKVLMQEAVNELLGQISKDFAGKSSVLINRVKNQLADAVTDFANNYTGKVENMAEDFKAVLPEKYEAAKTDVLKNDPATIKSNVLDEIIEGLNITDSALLQKIGKALDTTASDFLKNYKGKDLKTDLKTHLENYLNNTDATLIADSVAEYQSVANSFGAYIDSDELVTLKEYATELLKSALSNGVAVKLGATTIKNEAGITSVISKYTDGAKLQADMQEFINSLSTENRIATLQKEVEKEKAEALEKENKAAVEEGKAEVTKYITETLKPGNDDVTFFVNDKGEVVFVNYEVAGGAFNDTTNFTLQNKFKKLRTEIETSFKKIIESLNLSETEKTNLFNIALYLTLSDTSIVSSMYDSQDISAVMKEVLNNYSSLLDKATSNEKTREYITNYPKGSILAGTTTSEGLSGVSDLDYSQASGITRNLSKYYTNNSTGGKDDWVYINTRKEEGYTYGGGCGNIMLLNETNTTDNNVINNAMKAMLRDYIVSYKSSIEPDRIFELFRLAQETAFANLEAVSSATSANGTSIYGYGEARNKVKDGKMSGCDNTDTMKAGDGGRQLYSAGSVLINIAYEMEKLIAREMAGLN